MFVDPVRCFIPGSIQFIRIALADLLSLVGAKRPLHADDEKEEARGAERELPFGDSSILLVNVIHQSSTSQAMIRLPIGPVVQRRVTPVSAVLATASKSAGGSADLRATKWHSSATQG